MITSQTHGRLLSPRKESVIGSLVMYLTLTSSPYIYSKEMSDQFMFSVSSLNYHFSLGTYGVEYDNQSTKVASQSSKEASSKSKFGESFSL